MIQQALHLFKKELLVEWRQKYAISGILTYVLSTVFVIYVAFVQMSPRVWNVLFWMILLFSSVNAIAKSFVQESSARQLYYYSLAHPLAVLFSKLFYNILLLLVLNVLVVLSFSWVAGFPVQNLPLFLWSALLGTLAFALIFTFISAIANKTRNTAIFMAILSFPVIIPVFYLLIPVSAVAMGIEAAGGQLSRLWILLGINLLLFSLSILLFPYLWRE